MTVKLQRPILVGGIGLSFLLWMLESLHHSAGQLGEFGVMGAIALGGGWWLMRQMGGTDLQLQLDGPPVDPQAVEKAIAQTENAIAQLETEAENPEAIAQLRQRLAQAKTELDRQERRVAVTGGKAVGKTSLIEVLEQTWLPEIKQPIGIKETDALLKEDAEATADRAAWESAIAADLVLFITNGDLTDSEFQFLQQLKAVNQRILLVFNKQDQYVPEDRQVILEQLQQRMQGKIGKEDVVAIAAAPRALKVRQYQADGSVQEWLEEQKPEIVALLERLNQILAQESDQLVQATAWRAAMALKAEAKTQLNEVRRDRALPLIEQYQWIAAATAFANPVPVFDLLATGAIAAQMVLDLSNLYQQKFSLQQAQTIARTMGSLMVKLGLVELSTQTIGSILKGQAITFVAGGAVQGVSAAYLTRLAGLSLIEYFQNQEVVTADAENPLNLERLRQTLQTVFQQNQRTAFLQSFVKQAIGRLLPESPQAQLTAAETIVSG